MNAFGYNNSKTRMYFSSIISQVEIQFFFGLAVMQFRILIKESNVTVNQQSSSIGYLVLESRNNAAWEISIWINLWAMDLTIY